MSRSILWPHSVAPEEERRLTALVRVGFYGFGDDEVPARAASGAAVLLVGADAEQMAGQSCIEKVKFRAFDNALVEITVVRGQQEEDEAGLQD